MTWLVWAILASLIWASCNLIEKVLLSKYVDSTIFYTVAIGFTNLLPLLLVPFQGLTIPPLHLLILSILTGTLYIYLLIPYFQALAIEEASRVVPLWRFTPLFVLIISGSVTNERLNYTEIIAFILLVLGGLLISIKRISDTFRLSKAFYLMLLSSLISAIYGSLTKLVYLHLDYADGFTWLRIGTFLSAISFLAVKKYRREVTNSFKTLSNNIMLIVILSVGLDFMGLIFYNLAVSMAPVSLVSALAGIQSVFVFLFSAFLSVKYPQLLREDLNRSTVIQKLLAISLIVIGTMMITH